jgi:hypothetical protein
MWNHQAGGTRPEDPGTGWLAGDAWAGEPRCRAVALWAGWLWLPGRSCRPVGVRVGQRSAWG